MILARPVFSTPWPPVSAKNLTPIPLERTPVSQPLIVTAAIVRRQQKVLITRRPEGSRHAGRWEFPGGKLEAGEAPEAGLARELREELDLPVRVDKAFDILYHRYDWGAVLLLVYECTPLAETMRNLEVAEHRFVPITQLKNYDILDADLPLIQRLVDDATTP